MSTLFWLKLIRADRGLTQQELADKIGITREQINHYENGRVTPQALNKYKIAQALGFDVELWEQNKKEV